ncbi:MAG: hypothetical protein WBG46_05860 [Nonlabens sp.]
MTRKPRELHPTYGRTKINQWFKNVFVGYSPKLVGQTAITGLYTRPYTKAKVSIRIKSILDDVIEAKIGVMGDLESRMDKTDYRTTFDYVQRVYKTKSKLFAAEMEVYMIKKFKKSHPNVILNVSETKANNMVTYNDFYYVYVVYNIPHT